MRIALSSETSWFLKQIRPLLKSYLKAFGLIFGGSLFALLDPLIIKWILDEILPAKDGSLLAGAAALFFLVYALRLTANGFGETISFRTSRMALFRIRLKLLRHVQRLSADFHGSTPVGDTLYRLERDVDQLENLGGDLVGSTLRIVFTSLFSLAVLFWLNWRLALCILPLLPVLLILKKKTGPGLRRLAEKVQSRRARQSSLLQEQVASMVQLQLLGRCGAEARRFVGSSRRVMEAEIGQKAAELTVGLSGIMVVVTALAVVLGYGGYQTVVGTMTLGSLIAFYTYLGRIFEPVEYGIELASRMQRAKASVRRLLELLSQSPRVTAPTSPVRLDGDDFRGSVELRGVAFHYPGRRPALRRLDLKIQPGERVALVGDSGSGKSTLASLLARLNDPSRGVVRISGRDVREFSLNNLRRHLVYLPQEPRLFDRSLEENLRLADPAVSRAWLEECAAAAQLGDLLTRLPGGWDEPVGVGGAKLSGGERQRLALARALLRRPRILVLDEATSALDSLTEKRFLLALDRLLPDSAVLMIAHRVSVMLWARRILVLRDGRIAEDGNHAQLLVRGGSYARYVRRQLARETTRDSAPSPPEFQLPAQPILGA